MIAILSGFIAIVLQWLTLYLLHRKAPQEWVQAKRSTWWLLGASLIVGIALIYNLVWLSLLGMLCALTAVSYIFQVFTNWLRKQKVNTMGLIVWLEWVLILSITIAHILLLALNYLHEAAA